MPSVIANSRNMDDYDIQRNLNKKMLDKVFLIDNRVAMLVIPIFVDLLIRLGLWCLAPLLTLF